MAGGRKDRHVDADLGDDALGRAFADPSDGVQPVTGRGERGDHLVHTGVEAGDRGLQVLQVPKRQPDQQRMMLPEAAPQGLAQLGKLLAQLALGQLGQDLGVAFAGDQGLEHGPARDAQDVGGDRVQLDASVLQGLLDPLALGAMGLDEPLAVADKVPQLPDLRRGHEAAAQQATLQQLTQPGGIADVGLAAGQDLDVAGIDQQQLQPALRQHIPTGLPVLPRRLHHHLGDALGLQPVRQGLQAGGERRVGADLLAATPATPTDTSSIRDADAGHHLVLADIQRRGPFHDQLHRLPPPTGSPVLVRPAGPTEETMLKRVLAANSSWCREGPRINLRHGLARTNESRAWPGVAILIRRGGQRRNGQELWIAGPV